MSGGRFKVTGKRLLSVFVRGAAAGRMAESRQKLA